MTTVTQWFPPDIKPVYFGCYESTVDEPYGSAEGASYNFLAYWWDGIWRWSHTGNPCMIQDRSWRGLAVKPKSGISSKRPQAT